MTPDEASRRTVETVWRMESAKVVAVLARTTGDIGLAEDLAQDALVEALEQWPSTGVPRNPGAWLTTVARRRAVDAWRRRARLDERTAELASRLAQQDERGPEQEAAEPIKDDLLRLIFTACHPVLPRPARVALALRVLGGLTTDEIARAFLVPRATMGQRISRAKRALADAEVPFEIPDAAEFPARRDAVLEVVYLIFNEGYSATAGSDWIRTDLTREATRLARVLAALLPREPEVLGLLALLELQGSRFAARVDAAGSPVLLEDQDRRRWDRSAIARGRAALRRAQELAPAAGPYVLQAALAECHAVAATAADTDWARIVALYDRLLALGPSPVVALNRAVALARADGPAVALEEVDRIAAGGRLDGYHLLAAVRATLLGELGRRDEARAEFERAAALTRNDAERALLLARAAGLVR